MSPDYFTSAKRLLEDAASEDRALNVCQAKILALQKSVKLGRARKAQLEAEAEVARIAEAEVEAAGGIPASDLLEHYHRSGCALGMSFGRTERVFCSCSGTPSGGKSFRAVEYGWLPEEPRKPGDQRSHLRPGETQAEYEQRIAKRDRLI